MNQDQLISLCFRIVLLAVAGTLLAFVADYTRLTKWGWARNPIGRTLVIKDLLLVLAIVPAVMSLFFGFSRRTSHIAAWIDIGVFAAIAVAMAWRIVVFERIHRNREPAGSDGEAGEGPGDE